RCSVTLFSSLFSLFFVFLCALRVFAVNPCFPRGHMTRTIRIGNQTAVSSAERMAPFEFALRHGFDAFEWFADKKWNPDGSTAGWDESDMDPSTRVWIRDTGRAHDVLFTVHAPWQANPLHEDGGPALLRSIDFARDIGAVLVNLHLYMDEGVTGYVRALG